MLVIDDEPGVRASVKMVLHGACEVLEAADGPAAIDAVRGGDVDVCLLDVRLPGMEGIEVLERIKRLDTGVEVVLVTAVHTVRTAVDAMKLGAYDYLTKPFAADDLRGVVNRALERRALQREVRYLRDELARHEGFDQLVGRSPAMRRVYELVRQVADTTATVLITGESGTGKELIARAIHRQGVRREHPFVAVNCAALPAELLESELFGHERGAFTGAHARKLGKFEVAHTGTLLLDEVGTLRLDLQPKLLRALQEREIERVGGGRPIGVDVRIVANTNTDLRQAVAAGRFREDLFYRLHVVPIAVPPLRERREDVAPLARHFLAKYSRQFGKPVTDLSPGVLDALERYHWPGNVRELENIMARSVALASEPVVQLDQIPLDVALAPAEPAAEDQLNLREARHEVERLLILRALDRAGGNQTVAARLLGMHRNTLLVKLAQLGLRAAEPGGAQSASSS
ncbi:MAG TPA: sigma-54 dependent transcriptional regulator [Methylomirabilota bacterium]|nr:sigma-54 dependent transcriptional regulator [Methylomirabilota bacterium]